MGTNLRRQDLLFMKIIKRYFQQKFTRHYLLVFLALIIFIFWPVFVFRDLIKFDPVLFTTEWVKVGLISVLLAILINIFVALRDKSLERKKYIEAIDSSYLSLIIKINFALDRYYCNLGSGNERKNAQYRANINHLWTTYRGNLNPGSVEFCDAIKQKMLRSEAIIYNLEKNDNRIAVITSTKKKEDICESEYEALKDYLLTTMVFFEELKKYVEDNF